MINKDVFSYAVTGTFHGSIIDAKSEGEARRIFHKHYKGESIIHIRKLGTLTPVDMNDKDFEERYSYLRNKVYENVKHRSNGRLYISTFYVRKVAEMLGGNYDSLTTTQQRILRSDIVDENINLDAGIEKYLIY